MRKEFSTVIDYEKRFIDMGAWGLQTNLDIHGCDPQLIRDAGVIREFVIQLCDLIKMKRFGEPVIVDFGEDERVSGYSMTQLIETSLISAHFANQSNTVYLDIFSCKYYDPNSASEFSRDFFKGKDCNINVVFRK
jgi:S-adenosylmethionine/arginine decarboxylase-like enzyme